MSRVIIGLILLAATVAVVRVAVVALLVVLMIVLLMSLITRPRETITGLLVLALCSLASAHPIPCLVTLGILALAGIVGRKPRRQLLLTND